MKIKVSLEDGYLPQMYSKYSDIKIDGEPVVSFPIEFSDVPAWAKTLAVVMVDLDSIPVCGFAWIHWAAANIPAGTELLAEDASRLGDDMVQGSNSCASPFIGEKDIRVTRRYIGPNPPDKDHTYTVMAYAIDDVLDLEDGFFLNELYKKMDGHMVEKAITSFLAKA